MYQDQELPKFSRHPDEDDAYDWMSQSMGRAHLPGQTMAEGNMFEYPALWMANCNMDSAIFDDKVWGYGIPDRLYINENRHTNLLSELFYSDAIRRLQAVEQLTLPPQYSTIPNTAAFSRFEHIWGSALFVKQIAAQEGINDKDTSKLQLRTLVSDVAHTFGSHLGDWMFQGIGGTEDQHDIELHSYLETVGINDILRRHDVEPEDVIFPDIQDWIEADQPDLCVDRVDYGLREMNRWNDTIRSRAFSSKDFTITPDNMLAMNDVKRARLFSEGFLLLSQEHWSEPTHRFMIDMLMLRTKLFYGEGNAPRSWVFNAAPKLGLVALHDIHPRDLMYVTDPAQEHAYSMPNLAGNLLEAIMDSVAMYRRQYVWPARKERIRAYLQQFVQGETNYTPLESEEFSSYRDEYPAALPTGFAILDAEQATSTKNDYCLDFPQPPFKTRQIDPLVRSGNGFARLSELDPSYSERLEEHSRALAISKVARLAIADPRSLNLMKAITDHTEVSWQDRLSSSRRMTPEELKSLVTTSAREIHGTYPFMTFYQY